MRPLGSSFWWAAYRVLRRRLLMSIDQESAHRIATQLEQSERSRQHITQLSTAYPQLSIADAYAVQQAWVALKMSQGRSIEGHKVGLTSKAMQLAFGIDEDRKSVVEGKRGGLGG